MLVGFHTEVGFTDVRQINGRAEPDVTTAVPVGAALAHQDGRAEVFAGDYRRLAEVLADPRYTVVVHGAHAAGTFCRLTGVPFPRRYVDTLLAGVVLVHADTFRPVRGTYSGAGLAALTGRFGIPFIGVDENDVMRDSVLHLRHEREFGLGAVTQHCLADAVACLRLWPVLRDAVTRRCGSSAITNLERLHQPFARVMADVAAKGVRFDQDGWGRLVERGRAYRHRLVAVAAEYGYDHDGGGLGGRAFERLLRRTGLHRDWSRTPTGQLRTREADLKEFRHRHPTIDALYRLSRFDSVMGQRLGERVDRDGRLRCTVLPLAQRSSRTSTVRPNLSGLPGDLRPLLLPDPGHVFVHMDFTQQEPGVAAALSGDRGLLADFAAGDVYENLGRRLGLVTPATPAAEVRRLRNVLLKPLLLSILYGRAAVGLARCLGCGTAAAAGHLDRFARAYPRLAAWTRGRVAASMARGWAGSVVGFRAAFDVRDPRERSHVERSCQNFGVQASAAACFQATGVHLAADGLDVRLGLHDAYLLQVPADPGELAAAVAKVWAAARDATGELFPGLAVKLEVETLNRFAKDADQQSLDRLLRSIERGEDPCPAH